MVTLESSQYVGRIYTKICLGDKMNADEMAMTHAHMELMLILTNYMEQSSTLQSNRSSASQEIPHIL